MPEISLYAPGSVCWTDLSTTDREGAIRFYSTLFDWTSVDNELAPGVTYSMAFRHAKQVTAITNFTQEELQQKVPSHWSVYISVGSANEAAAKVKSLGGKILVEPFDLLDVGRKAVAQDPSGATFVLWEPRKHQGAQLHNEPNTPCWYELMTNNVDGCVEFYSGLFGWNAKRNPEYVELDRGGQPHGGMLPIKPEWGPMQPNWSVYFEVADCDEIFHRAKELGATVCKEPTTMPKVGRFAVLQDPQGALFNIITLE